MAIIISPPAPAAQDNGPRSSDDEDEGTYDREGDVQMAEAGAAGRRRAARSVVTPGEIITDDPQWMRYARHNIRRDGPTAETLIADMALSYLPILQV